MQESSGCTLGVSEETGHIPLAVVNPPPSTRILEDDFVDWEVCKAEARCVSWVLSSTTDTDVIYSTVRFAADTIWYPEIAGALSPHILADLFFGCLLDGEVIPGKSEHAISIGMALASVLSIQLTMEPENQALGVLCERILDCVKPPHSTEPTYMLVAATLDFVAGADGLIRPWNTVKVVPTTQKLWSASQKLWLSRIVLQVSWRWRRRDESTNTTPDELVLICNTSTADDDRTPTIVKTSCFLAMTIDLGLRIDICDLYAPNNKCVIPHPFRLVRSLSGSDALGTATLQQLRRTIEEGETKSRHLTFILSTLSHLDPFKIRDNVEYGFLWIGDLLNSRYPDHERYSMASRVVQLLGERIDDMVNWGLASSVSPLVNFLSLGEQFYSTESTPYPGLFALGILSMSSPEESDFGTTVLLVLASILMPTHPLKSRRLALDIFRLYNFGWFSFQIESASDEDLSKLLQAVGDPFQFPDLPLQDGQPVITPTYGLGLDWGPM